MTYVVTARDGDTFRIEASGANATIKLIDQIAQLLFLQVPESLRRQGAGRELLEAAEKEAAFMGAAKMCCDYTDQVEGMSQFLEGCGYTAGNGGHIVSVDTKELLSSQGVTKSMRIRFKNITTKVLDDIFMFQWEDMGEFLNRHGFQIRDEDFDRYDPCLSSAAYDADGNLRAVLLSTVQADRIYIELLLGFSSRKPEYVLCVCQEFARALNEMMKETVLNRIYIYSCSEYVEQLLKRLLDKKNSMKSEHLVLHAEKELEPGGIALDENLTGDKDIWLWQSEAEEFMGQRNINEKAVWMTSRR